MIRIYEIQSFVYIICIRQNEKCSLFVHYMFTQDLFQRPFYFVIIGRYNDRLTFCCNLKSVIRCPLKYIPPFPAEFYISQ